MDLFITRLIFSSMLLISTSSWALDYTDLTAYEIEVVIFKHQGNHYAASETWPDLVETVALENMIELKPTSDLKTLPGVDEPGYYYSTRQADTLRLNQEASKLRNSGKYQILFHQSWIQPGLDENTVEAIHVYSNDDLSDAGREPVLFSDKSNTEQNETALIIQSDSSLYPRRTLDGKIKVVLARYLHIYFDLIYQRNLTPNDGVLQHRENTPGYQDIRQYPIQLHRRMRSKEIHYIDHPLVGMLVLATPFEAPVEETAEPVEVSPILPRLGDIPASQ